MVGDLTHIHCGADGWAHLAAIIDCHDREIVGYEFARRGRAKKTERPGRRLRRPGRGNPAAASPAEEPVERVRYNRAASVEGTRGELFIELSVPHDLPESSHRWRRPTATALRPMSHPPASVETRTPR